MNTSLLLFVEFVKVGLFTFGGGYGSLPFLYQICDTYNWFTYSELTQLIAISGITPGPIGLNMATFSGFKTLGVAGGIITSIALILPMFVIASIIYKIYDNFYQNKYLQYIQYILRPTSCALLASVGIKLFDNLILNHSLNIHFISIKALILFVILFIATFKLTRNPIIYMFLGLIGGVFFYILKI